MGWDIASGSKITDFDKGLFSGIRIYIIRSVSSLLKVERGKTTD